MRIDTATVVVGLAKEGWFYRPEDREQSSLEARVKAAIAGPDDNPVMGSLRQLTEQAQVALSCGRLLTEGCDDHITVVAQELLREFWAFHRAQYDNSPGEMHSELDGGDIDESGGATPNQHPTPRPEIDSGLSWGDFSRASKIVLTSVAMTVRKSPANAKTAAGGHSGRGGSLKFDDWLQKTIEAPRLKKLVLHDANEALKSQLAIPGVTFTVTYVGPDDSVTDAGKSTAFADLWIHMDVAFERSNHLEHFRLPVNVKYFTSGSKAFDNTGGMRMMAWAMLGGRCPVTKAALLTERIRLNIGNDLPNSDYYFLAFEKSADAGDRLVETVWVSSLLGLDPDTGAAYYNPAQSYPSIQINFRDAPSHTEITETVTEARMRLWDWWSAGVRMEVQEKATSVGAGRVSSKMTVLESKHIYIEGFVLPGQLMLATR